MFRNLVAQLPNDRSSFLYRELAGEHADWGLPEHLLAAAVDALNGGNWQRAGRKGTPRPQPVPRPGSQNRETYTGDSVPLDEMKRRFAERRARWMAEAGEVG
jgi:hypothetical protein